MKHIFPFFLASVLLVSCSTGYFQTKEPSTPSVSGQSSAVPEESNEILEGTTRYHWIADTSWVDSTLQSLSLRDKVAQMVVPFTYAPYASDSGEMYQRLVYLVKDLHVGGFVVSLGNVYEQAMLLNKLQKISSVPLLFSSDYEYGLGMRLQNGLSFPSNMALGATRDSSLVYRIGHAIGEEARAVGILENYAPVSDVNDNPENPIINVRSFGENPRLVGKLAVAFLKGTQDAGVLATAKHFPGHGDTQVDSHSELPTINYGYDRLDTLELIPFRDDIAAGVRSVMIAHIAFPKFQNETGVPATLSNKITTGLLRDSLGFHGLIVTDALTMGGVTKKYSTADAAIRAVKAGADILLMPPDEEIAINAITRAVERGEINPAVIDAAVRRILTVKSELSLEKRHFINVDDISKIVGTESHELLAAKAARRSITIVRNIGDILPLQYHQPQQVLCLSV
ncbi:MAG TPA: glycoside hydrolase family 3 N-terminal domain-containing protein, partial [Candidatus Kryptobacter bacterium]